MACYPVGPTRAKITHGPFGLGETEHLTRVDGRLGFARFVWAKRSRSSIWLVWCFRPCFLGGQSVNTSPYKSSKAITPSVKTIEVK